MTRHLKLTIGRKIYVIMTLGFAGLLGVAALSARQLSAGLEDQKGIELKHLTDIAVAMAQEQYTMVQKGMLTDEEAQQRAQARIAGLRYNTNDYFWINDIHVRMVIHPFKPELNGRDLADIEDPSGKFLFREMVDVVKRQGGGLVSYEWPKPGFEQPQPKLSYVSGFAPWGWVVGTGVYIDDLRQQVWHTISQVLLIAAVVAIIAGVASMAVARPMSRALRGMVDAMIELAEGNFEVVLPGLGRDDEIGEVARAVESFKAKAVERGKLDADREEATSRAAAATRKVELGKLAVAFGAAVGGVLDTVSSASAELDAAASTLTRTAENTQQLSAKVAAAAEEASGNVQSVASATEQLTASVREISRQVHDSSGIAGEAVHQAERTDARILELSQAASRIGDVVKLISAIAEQTNLLALNATIEAARAGEAGRGFAVVASEVKALANQTAKATGEIGVQIAGMQAATTESVAAIKEIGATIGRISQIASSIAISVEQQDAATQEIARNVHQAAHGTSQVATNITEVDRGAAETGSASSRVLASARSLSGESNQLRLEVEKFLATVQAA
jgi:methyl-accepting chemotaxis protein